MKVKVKDDNEDEEEEEHTVLGTTFNSDNDEQF